MQSITLSVHIDEDRHLDIELPPNAPIGRVELIIRALPEATPVEPTREAIAKKLREANFLVTTITAPSDVIVLSPEALLEVGKLPPDARPSHELIAEERG